VVVGIVSAAVSAHAGVQQDLSAVGIARLIVLSLCLRLN